jgi:hypothetical protein
MGNTNSLSVAPECQTSRVYRFYQENWQTLLATEGNTPIYDQFKKACTLDSLCDYFGSGFTGVEEKEFDDHLNDVSEPGLRQKYIDAMRSGTDAERKVYYEKFWYHPENMHRARKIKKLPKDPLTPEAAKVRETLLLEATNRNWIQRPSWEIFAIPKQATFTPDQFPMVVREVSNLLNVSLIPNWYLYGYWTNTYKFSIYNSPLEGNKKIGEVYLRIKESGTQAKTIPLTPASDSSIARCLVITPPDFNLPHELTHAIHYAFVPFWKVSKTVVEIPAMIVENHFRQAADCEYSDHFLRKQIGVALADLHSETPEEFNEAFARFANLTDVGHIAARFWHYAKYDKKILLLCVGTIRKWRLA